VNPHGATAAGALEAHWKFDEAEGSITPDSSGNALSGILVNEPTFTEGIDGRALQLNGVDQHVNFGNPPALQLTGSVTITAWINPARFPVYHSRIGRVCS